MNEELLTKGNLTTFATWIAILIYPVIIGWGIEIDQVTLTSLVYTLIVIIVAIVSSKNPNTLKFLGNSNKSEPTTEEAVGEDGV